MPLAFAFGIAGILCAAVLGGTGSLAMLAHTLYESVHSFELLTIPLFVLMGAVIAASPSGKDLYETVHRFLYRLPGGIAMSNIVACTLFAAMCGSSPATAAAIGTPGIPEMQKRGISDELATGTIVGGGTLGILVPPSITLIVYGIATESSIGQLFIAGIIPGILVTILFCIWIFFNSFYARSKFVSTSTISPSNSLKESYSLSQKLQHLPKVAPFITLIVLVLYSIYGGIATPSEAAAIGAFGSLLMVVTVYRRSLTKESMLKVMQLTVNQTAMIMLIAATTVFFGTVLTNLFVIQKVAMLATSIEASRWTVMVLINFVLLILGGFLPPFVVILLMAPILAPVLLELDFNIIWFGVVMTINMEVGCITPPFGINLFVVKGIAPEIPMTSILKGSIPFVVILLLAIVILCLFPEIALWLPSKMQAG
jgi:tripartite ATP-independent transporter DctM subunit